jgi:magnesium transporter
LDPGSSREEAIRVDMLNAQEEIIGTVASQIATLERDILRCDPVRSEAMLGDLFALRHDLQSIRTNAAQTHELYDHLIETLETQPGVMQVDLNRVRDLRQGFSHLKNTADLEREYLQEMLDLFQTRVATELNRFVRKVTAGGTIAVAWTVIAGIYGMNFKNMPELSWAYGYPLALGLMLAIGAALAVMFRRSGWL